MICKKRELAQQSVEHDSEKKQRANWTIVQETAAMAANASTTTNNGESMTTTHLANNNNDSSSSRCLFVWGDLDPEAYALNHLRLMDEEICETDHDLLMEERKIKRRTEQNIATWDDWFSHIRTQASDAGEAEQVHLIFEAAVPPWDVELERNNSTGSFPNMVHRRAADCIRSLPNDEDMHELDAHDPSSDGFGSYLDFCYRKFMAQQLLEGESLESSLSQKPKDPLWFHCVDHRDLGCEDATCAKALKPQWHNLLTPDEQTILTTKTSNGKPMVPPWKTNPEDVELESLRTNGKLSVRDDEEEKEENDDKEKKNPDKDDQDEEDYFTFPSFEGFFGQISNVLYYDLHAKLSYAPFLSKCVGSMSNWHDFFTSLFFGGTISDAMSHLQIETNEGYLHVRSPLQKIGDSLYERDTYEFDATFPFFPVTAFLKAKGSGPSRTWSSNLYHTLLTTTNHTDDGAGVGGEGPRLAHLAREWALDRIQRYAKDPKTSDAGGGEWFLAYLHAAHRDIYDDIDISDCALLAEKTSVPSITQKVKKYKIGKIAIPSCQDAFETLMEESAKGKDGSIGDISDRSEIMAKIIMDIYM
eukprot:scaffold4508_cov43-Attheya_sp.AAC.2